MPNEIVGFFLQSSPVSDEAWDLVLRNARGEAVKKVRFGSFVEAAEVGCALFPEPASAAQGATL